jgi:anhydro-N-acetylmuramic acid kinase
MEWLEARLEARIDPQDVQATLAAFTARAIIESVDRFCAGTQEIYLCGGGARNPHLVQCIAALARGRSVRPTDVLGVPSAHMEAMAFAWLAMKCIRREPVDLSAATGARGPRVLGAIYPA